MKQLIKYSFLLLVSACGRPHFDLKDANAGRAALVRSGSGVLREINGAYQTDYEAEFQRSSVTDLVKASRRASLVLIGRNPTTVEIQRVQTRGAEAYQELLQSYLNSAEFQGRIHNFHLGLFQMGGNSGAINFNEAANLADYLVVNKRDQREVLTADFCVNDSLAVVPCTAFASMEQQKQYAAGVLTTRGFLVSFDGPFFFKRTRKLQEFFTCKSFPLSNETGLSLEEISGTLKPFNSLSETPQCYSCHRSMNTRAALFFDFDRKGKFNPNPNQTVSTGEVVLTDTGAAANRTMLLAGSPQLKVYGRTVSKLQDVARITAGTRDFRDCMVQRYGNFLLGQTEDKGLPAELAYVQARMDQHNFQVKTLMLDILKSQKFIGGEAL